VRALLAATLLTLTGCGACEPDRTPSAKVSTSGSASSLASSAPPAPSAAPAARPPRDRALPQHLLACRVVTLDGDARVEAPGQDAGTAPLLLQGLAPPEAWIDLAAGSRVVARDPHTTRETTFRGPARVRACTGFTEESWVASGRFESSVGAGESPGAEEWVVTPSGVVRYTAAEVSVDVTRHGAVAILSSGVAFAWGTETADAGAALEEGWRRLTPGKTPLATHEEPVSSAVDRCASLASTARSLAAQVMAPGGAPGDGTIPRQVTARRLARAACAVATLRVNALAPADAAPLLRPVADANSAWSGLPLGLRGPDAGPAP
jgi:hypothetical protein